MSKAKWNTREQLVNEGITWVSEDGRSIEYRGKICRDYDMLSGYRAFKLYNPETRKIKNLYSHRAVALWYIGDIPEDCQVDHIDHDGWNNNKDNLRIIPAGINIRNQNR